MVPHSFRPMFDMLSTRTLAGEVNWRPTADDSVVALHMQEFSLTMRYGHDNSDDTEFVRIDLVNQDGKSIDGFWIDSTEPEWKRAEEMFTTARRKALRLDEAIALIMDALSRGDSVGLDKKPSNSPFEDDDLPF